MKPRHGQHFLTDRRVLDRIIQYADLTKKDTVLEIGGGTGILTRRLAEAAGCVITIELDPELSAGLRHLTEGSNVIVIQGDALKVPLPEFNRIVSNLPYRISSNITFRLLRHSFDFAILMYQLEFARRMLAPPGSIDYSRLSVMAQYYAAVEMLEVVPPSAFKPSPKVHSALLKITPAPPPYHIKDMDFFEKFLKSVFSQRRKKLKNSILAAAPMLDVLPETVLKINTGILDKRPETLSPRELADLANTLK